MFSIHQPWVAPENGFEYKKLAVVISINTVVMFLLTYALIETYARIETQVREIDEMKEALAGS